MPVSYTALVEQLQALRRGEGLTLQGLSHVPAVLEALGDPPINQAYDQLVAVLQSLGDSEPAVVLRTAYGLESSYSGAKVTHRREKYRDIEGRDIKTLLRYEDQMIKEVATQLARGAQKGRLFVAGWVADRRLSQGRVEFTEETPYTPLAIQTNFKNISEHRSLPLFIYRLPPAHTPSELVIGLFFQDDQPRQIWGIHTPDLWEVPSLRYERRLLHEDGDNYYYIEYAAPTQNYYYGLGWEW